MPLYRRLPKRGFTNARFRTDYTVVNVSALGVFDDGATSLGLSRNCEAWEPSIPVASNSL